MRCGGYAFHVLAHFIVETIPTTIFYAPVLRRGYAPKKRNHHERRFFFCASSAEHLWE
jgi:hypothetical protein